MCVGPMWEGPWAGAVASLSLSGDRIRTFPQYFLRFYHFSSNFLQYDFVLILVMARKALATPLAVSAAWTGQLIVSKLRK